MDRNAPSVSDLPQSQGSPQSQTPGAGDRPPSPRRPAPWAQPERGPSPLGARPKNNTQPRSRETLAAGARRGPRLRRATRPGAANLESAEPNPRRGVGGGCAVRARGGPERCAPSAPPSCLHTLHPEAQSHPVLPSPQLLALTHRRGRPAPRPVAAGRRIGERASPRRRRP